MEIKEYDIRQHNEIEDHKAQPIGMVEELEWLTEDTVIMNRPDLIKEIQDCNRNYLQTELGWQGQDLDCLTYINESKKVIHVVKDSQPKSHVQKAYDLQDWFARTLKTLETGNRALESTIELLKEMAEDNNGK